jgi:signal transduction histidine kinase
MTGLRFFRSFQTKALVSALAIMAAALIVSIAATTVLSTATINTRLLESVQTEAAYAADYFEAVMQEAVSQVEMVAEDAYVTDLAAQMTAEADAFRRSRIADELTAYLGLRYLGLAQPVVLVLVGDGLAIGVASSRPAASSYRSIRNLSAFQSPPDREPTPEDPVASALSLASGGDHPPSPVLTRSLTIRISDTVILGALVDLGLVLKGLDRPAAILDARIELPYGNSGWNELGVGTTVRSDGNPSDGTPAVESRRDVVLARAHSVGADVSIVVASSRGGVSASVRAVVRTLALVSLGTAAAWTIVLRWLLRRLFAPLADLNSELTIPHVPDRATARRIVHTYRRRVDLQRALRWWYLSVLIPVGLCIAGSAAAFSGLVHDQAVDAVESGVAVDTVRLARAVRSLHRHATTLALDPEIQALLGSRVGYTSYAPPDDLSSVVLRKANLFPGISQVTVYDRAGTQLYPSGPLRFDPRSDSSGGVDLSRLTAQEGVIWFLQPDRLEVALGIRIRGLPHPLHTVAFLNHLGFLVIRSRGLFDGASTSVLAGAGATAAIVDRQTGAVRRLSGDVHSGHAGELIAYADELPPNRVAAPGTNARGVLTWRSEVPGTDWVLVHVVDRSRLAGPMQLLPYSAVVFGLVVLLLLLAADLATARLLRPVEALHSWMENVALDDPVRSGPVGVDNEFVHLAAGLEEMLDRLSEMAAEVRRREVAQVELERSRKELQLVALQTQMNPHFLHNVFSSVSLLIDMRRTDEASAMLDATARLFRRGMYRGELLVPLSEELEHTRAYLEIQQIRHRGCIEAVWSVDETLLGELVPKFIVQPLVENSIEHGMRDRERLRVEASVVRVEGALLVRVSDDGSGMTASRLAHVRAQIHSPTPGAMEALSNINARVRLECGNENAVAIDGSEEGGCIVAVTIPSRGIER